MRENKFQTYLLIYFIFIFPAFFSKISSSTECQRVSKFRQFGASRRRSFFFNLFIFYLIVFRGLPGNEAFHRGAHGRCTASYTSRDDAGEKRKNDRAPLPFKSAGRSGFSNWVRRIARAQQQQRLRSASRSAHR